MRLSMYYIKIKLLEVLDDTNIVKIELSPTYTISEWVKPKKYAEGLLKNALAEDVQYSSDVEYMIDGKIEDFLIEAQEECNGIVKALKYMKEEIDWDFAIFHIHFLDTVNHYSLGYIYEDSPMRKIHPEKIEKSRLHIETAYRTIDKMIGNLADDVIDENTTVIFLSDHGAIPVWKTVNLSKVFAQSSLTNYVLEGDKYKIDWSSTKAFPYFEPHYVWVNLIGRDPNGIVPKEEYEAVREEIIVLLECLEDPETGKKIMRCVFKKEDAAFLGQNGERVGDVVYFLNPPYQLFDGSVADLDATIISKYLWEQPIVQNSKVCYGAHAYYLPTTEVGIFSVSVPLIISGPTVDTTKKLIEPINLIDIAPTIAQIFGVPRPKNSQGRILHEILKK
jgi:predicted AlkP superfamily phosphohydrolase/phosphomutase